MYVDDGGAQSPGPGSLVDSIKGFADAASAGQVEVSEEGGQAMLNAIQGLKDRLAGQEPNLQVVSTQPPLGRLMGGQVMAPFMQQVAVDENGLVTRITQLRESLDLAEEGIRKSMEKYRQTEEANRTAVNKIQGEFG